MSTNGVNNLSKAELAKLALNKKGIDTSSTQKPSWMTSDGSIWNAPQKTETKPASVSDLKSLDPSNLKTKKDCEKALEDINNFTQGNPLLTSLFKGKIEEITKKKSELSFNESQQNLQNIAEGNTTNNSNAVGSNAQTESKESQKQIDAKNLSASEGRAMANDLNKQSSELESQTKQVENDAKTANNYSKDAQKKQKELTKDQKKLDKEYKTASKNVQKSQEEIATLTDSLNTDSEEVTRLQSELTSLMSANSTGVGVNSAYSLSLAGTEEYNQAQQEEDPNAARIAELQGQISTKSASMQKTGAKIGKLQTSTNKQIKTMHKVSLKYMANVQNTQAALETNEKASDKILKVANTVEQISSTVATVGTSVKTAGATLIALGSSTSWCFGAGAALIAAGTVMQKVGTVAEVVGQYGQLAANVTKTACYAAQGNLAGALTSAGAAIMSGTSAVKGTQEMGNTFKAIDQKATEATQKLAAGVTARETVNEMAEKGTLGNLSKKQARKLAQEGAMEQLKGQSADAIKDSFKKGASDSLVKTAASNGAEAAVGTAVDATANMSKEAIKEGLKKGTISLSERSSAFVKQAAQELKNELKVDFRSAETWNKIGNGLQVAGAKMQQIAGNNKTSAPSSGQARGGYAPHYLTNPAKGYSMIAETQMRREKLAARHAA